MVVIENAEAVHGAWHASVEASEAKQKATGESHPEEEDDSHPWFKSGHERRQDIAAGNIPANIKPAPIEPPQSSAQQRPQAAAPKPRQEVMAAAAAQQPQQQPPQRPGRRPDPPRPAKPLADAPPPLPEMAETWFGASLFDWLLPVAAVVIAFISIQIFKWGNVETPTLSSTRYFSPVTKTSSLSAKLYKTIEHLPLVCPHGHVDAEMFVNPKFSFGDPANLFITPDHYIFRMLHSQGIDLASLNIPDAKGEVPSPRDPKEVWRTFAENFHLFRGTPSGLWVREALARNFNITEKLSPRSADRIYAQVQKAISEPSFKPLSLLDEFKIETLATTNFATDDLEHHRRLFGLTKKFRVRPTFRPDDVTNVLNPKWAENIRTLGSLAQVPVTNFASFLKALEGRRKQFADLGATSSDHGAERPLTLVLSPAEAQAIFARATAGSATAEDARRFSAHMLVESARMSARDGLVMQLHAGVRRNHDPALLSAFGPDKGADIPLSADWTDGLAPLLGELGNHPNLTLVLFTLDESTYARELAPLAGYYSAVRLGPPWWFHDSRNGMRRYLDSVVETAGVANLAGFNDDTRAFLSIPARHTVWRRVVADWVADLHARGAVDWEDALAMAHDLAYGLAKKTYKL